MPPGWLLRFWRTSECEVSERRCERLDGSSRCEGLDFPIRIDELHLKMAIKEWEPG